MEEAREIVIPPEKREQIIKDLKLFLIVYSIRIMKINQLDLKHPC